MDFTNWHRGSQEQQQQLEAEFDAATELLLCAREQLSKSVARELLMLDELLGLTKGS
jgi:hypothetical protein